MSELENIFERWLQARKIVYYREYKFIPNRRFRADFFIPAINCLVEIEGGVWSNGRHNRGDGYIKDCDKYNLATLHGYRLLRFTTEHIKFENFEVLEKMLY